MTERLLDALRALVDQRVEAKLASLGLVADEYRSSAPARGVSRRTHNRVCRSGKVAGAYRDGAEWVCSASAWRTARAGTRLPGKPTLALVQDHGDVGALLQAAGLRPTRGAR